jgi:hypothetical protein
LTKKRKERIWTSTSSLGVKTKTKYNNKLPIFSIPYIKAKNNLEIFGMEL